MSVHPNFVTPAGHKLRRDKVKECEEERARLREQEDELATQLHLPRVEQELRYWAERLRTAISIDLARQPRDKLAFGSVVTVADEDGKQRDYTLVGEDEADPQHGKVSLVSPLARALDGAELGDAIVWQPPACEPEL